MKTNSATNERFSHVHQSGQFLGWTTTIQDSVFFFGAANVEADLLAQAFPDLEFHRVQQVHGTNVVPSSAAAAEADAHFTAGINIGIRISTADCIPLLMASEKWACAVHAGWRGVLAGIIPAALASLHKEFGKVEAIHALIGPHIRQESFEVDLSLAEKFDDLGKELGIGPASATHQSQPLTKALVDLERIATAQLNTFNFGQSLIIDTLPLNTMTDPRLHSFRREKRGGTRNYSFVARR